MTGAAFQAFLAGNPHEYWGILERTFDADAADDADRRGDIRVRPNHDCAALRCGCFLRSLSFPRKRESMQRVRWIPAFAGMTVGEVLEASGFQTPLVGAGFQAFLAGKPHGCWGVPGKTFDADGADDTN
jgi:hypothetical protein